MLQCYVDESGNNQGPVMVMAGVIAPPAAWARFSVDWQECLDMRPRMKALHMAEMTQSWGHETQARIARFRKILCDHVKGSIVISIPLEDYRDVFGAQKPWSNPYLFMFFALIRAYKNSHKKIGLGKRVEFIFDEQMGAMSRVTEAWEFFRNHAPRMLDFVGFMPAFKNDEMVLPLQGADLLSWWIRRQIASDMAGENRLAPPWVGTDSIPCLRQRYDREGLMFEYNQMFRPDYLTKSLYHFGFGG